MKSIVELLKRVRRELLLYAANHFVAQIPCHACRLFFYRNFMQFEIGERSFIFMGAWFDARRGLKIGHHSVINQKCRLDTRGGIEIGHNVSISAETCILTADHDPKSPSFAGRERPVRVEDFAFVGTRTLILPGVTIGRGAIVAAGAVVTRDVLPFHIVAGCPAKQIGVRTKELSYQIDYGRLFF